MVLNMASLTGLSLNDSDTALLKHLTAYYGSRAKALRIGLRFLSRTHRNQERLRELLAEWAEEDGYSPTQDEMDATAKS